MKLVHGILAWALCVTAALGADPERLWLFAAEGSIQSSPAIGSDGTVYFGCDEGRIYALRPGGALLWNFKTGGSIAATPAIAPDGTVYAGSTDRVLYAFTPDGRLKWLQSPGGPIAASPAVMPDGGVVAATVFNAVVAYGPSGTKRWEFRAGGNIVSSPAVGADGTVYFGAKDNRLYALSAEGRLKWRYEAQGNFNASPALGADGTVYLGSLDGVLHAVNADGSKRWEFQAGDAIRSSVALAADGTVHFGCDDRKLYALTSEGKLKWAFETGGQVRSSPAVDADGNVYVGSYDHKLHAVSASGAARWAVETAGYVSSSPALRGDGTVLIASWDKQLYAVGGGGALANSTWPKFRGDARTSGALPEDKGAARLSFLVTTDRQVTAPALVKMVATLTGRDRAASKVEFFAGETKLGEVTTAPFAWNWPDAGAGEHVLSARATMLSGQVLVSSQVKVTVHAGRDAVPVRPLAGLTGPPDHVPPRVFLSAPLTETRFESAELDLRGKADDNVRVAGVEYRLNDLPYQKASGNITWSAKVRLNPGENKLAVRAVDTAGNYSTELTRTLYYALRVPLEVAVAGEGAIRSDQEDRLVEVGRKVNLQAQPVKGHVFAGWTGSLTNNAPDISFTMTEGLRLKALFLPNPYAALAGEFTGLITEQAGNVLKGVGLLHASITERGDWSGRVWLGGETLTLSGVFGPTGVAVMTIPRAQGGPLRLALHVNLGGDADLITGSLDGGGASAGVIGDRHVFDGREARAPQSGQYTVVITTKDVEEGMALGDGFGAVSVDERGVARLTGMLGDGTPVKYEAAISRQGVWPVFIALRGGQGSLSGWIRFKQDDFGDMFGQLIWKRAAGTHETTLQLLGVAYLPPARGRAVLARKEGVVALRGGDLPEALVENVRLESGARIAQTRRAPSELVLSVASATGLFSGSFIHPLTGRPAEVQGALLQRQALGAGVFVGPTNTGRVSFTFDLGVRAGGP